MLLRVHYISEEAFGSQEPAPKRPRRLCHPKCSCHLLLSLLLQELVLVRQEAMREEGISNLIAFTENDTYSTMRN